MVFEERLEGFENLDFAADTCRVGRVTLDDSHAKRALVPRHQTLEMLEKKLQERKRQDYANEDSRS